MPRLRDRLKEAAFDDAGRKFVFSKAAACADDTLPTVLPANYEVWIEAGVGEGSPLKYADLLKATPGLEHLTKSEFEDEYRLYGQTIIPVSTNWGGTEIAIEPAVVYEDVPGTLPEHQIVLVLHDRYGVQYSYKAKLFVDALCLMKIAPRATLITRDMQERVDSEALDLAVLTTDHPKVAYTGGSTSIVSVKHDPSFDFKPWLPRIEDSSWYWGPTLITTLRRDEGFLQLRLETSQALGSMRERKEMVDTHYLSQIFASFSAVVEVGVDGVSF